MDGWLKEVAPSHELRCWYHHAAVKGAEIQRRYRAELNQRQEAWSPLVQAVRRGMVTLLHSARDEEHSNTLAWKKYLDRYLKKTT